MANYRREIRMEVDLRRKGKVEKAIEFSERMRKVQETGVSLMRVQEEIKKQADRERRKAENWKVGNKVMYEGPGV